LERIVISMTLDVTRPQTPDYSGEGEGHFQAPDIKAKIRYKSGLSGKLTFRRVNEVTWNLTDGKMTEVPGQFGKWAGFRVPRAVAWITNVGKSAWLARFKDQCCGPLPFEDAKVAVLEMAKGGKGDYIVENPIAHLNELQALLHDREAA
jgi:hypothetical protein